MSHKNEYKILFPQVQDAFRCRLRNCQDPINADSSSSFPNGHAQIMVSFYLFSLSVNLNKRKEFKVLHMASMHS